MSLSVLDDATRAFVALAAAIAAGNETEVEEQCRTCMAEGAPETWVDELLLQSTLMVGWPRALSAAAIWRRIGGPARSLERGSDYGRAPEWSARGDAVCRVVYGSHYDRLRANIHALHPALDAWMVTEGYGRTMGRPGLDLARRELAVVARVAVQGAERQLHSHLKGALNAGVAPAVLDACLQLVKPILGARESLVLATLWDRIRAS
jgi:4-carboxymuconolactone decarboxylase